MPKRTVSKASYGYDLQARKNFSDEPEIEHANLIEKPIASLIGA